MFSNVEEGGISRNSNFTSNSPVTRQMQAVIQVPKDAYCMDFVFSNAEEGGIFDNRGGLDYHLPTEGSGEALFGSILVDSSCLTIKFGGPGQEFQ